MVPVAATIHDAGMYASGNENGTVAATGTTTPHTGQSIDILTPIAQQVTNTFTFGVVGSARV